MRQIATFDSAIPLLFDCSQAQVFIITLRNNVTYSRLKYITPGQLYTFQFKQKGGFNFTWPDACRNGGAISLVPGSTTTQDFIGNADGYMYANVTGTYDGP